MNKNVKKIMACLLGVLVVMCSTMGMVFASDDGENSSIVTPLTYSQDGGVQPLNTFLGDGGYSRLDYMSTGKYIKWEVNPKSIIVPYTFTGSLKIYKDLSQKPVKKFILSETGFGSEGGICDVASLAKGKYYAKLTGVADEIGGFGFYEVSPNAVISFTR